MEPSEMIEKLQSNEARVKFVDLLIENACYEEKETIDPEEREQLAGISLNLLEKGIVDSTWYCSGRDKTPNFWNHYGRIAEWGGLTVEVEKAQNEIKKIKNSEKNRYLEFFRKDYDEGDFLQAGYYALQIGQLDEYWNCLVKGARQVVTKNLMRGGFDWSSGLAERVKSTFPEKEKKFYSQAEKEELPAILEFMKVPEGEPRIKHDDWFNKNMEITRESIRTYPSCKIENYKFGGIGEDIGCPPEFKQLMVTGAVKHCETHGAYRMSGFLSKCLEDQKRAKFYEKIADLL